MSEKPRVSPHSTSNDKCLRVGVYIPQPFADLVRAEAAKRGRTVARTMAELIAERLGGTIPAFSRR